MLFLTNRTLRNFLYILYPFSTKRENETTPMCPAITQLGLKQRLWLQFPQCGQCLQPADRELLLRTWMRERINPHAAQSAGWPRSGAINGIAGAPLCGRRSWPLVRGGSIACLPHSLTPSRSGRRMNLFTLSARLLCNFHDVACISTNYKKLIRRWDSERELSLRRHCTRTKNAIDSCINSATYRFLQSRFTKFSKITQCNGHYAVQGHSRSPILVPIESSYTTSY